MQLVAVTAIATSLLAIGLLGAFGAAGFAAQQVREARKAHGPGTYPLFEDLAETLQRAVDEPSDAAER